MGCMLAPPLPLMLQYPLEDQATPRGNAGQWAGQALQELYHEE